MTDRPHDRAFSPSPHRTGRRFRHRTHLLLAGWCLLCVVAAALLVSQSVWSNERAFESAAARLADQVTDRALIAETALEGFSAFVMSQPSLDHAAAAEFAKTLLRRYPFLYKFEVAQKVGYTQRTALEEHLSAIYPGFRIRRFDYDDRRHWRDAPDASSYYPIVFQEPHFTDHREIVGLDLHSSDLLVEAMRESFVRGIPMATRPFTLVEDATGYVIHRALDHGNDEPFTADRYALLALRADRLFGDLATHHPTLAIRLTQGRDPGDGQGTTRLIDAGGQDSSRLERSILPAFDYSLSLADAVPSQPFELTASWQMTWRDLNLPLLLGLMLLALAAPLLARPFATSYFENRLAGLDSEGVLYQMANFDALTGVANRHRLLEEMELTLLRAERDNRGFCLLFIDIDQFKQVNDRLGHAAGDAVLVDFCHRVSAMLRADETMGRLGGDEFVLLTSDGSEPIDVPALTQRVTAALSNPIRYRKHEIPLHVSIGHACYPADGRNIKALLDAADRRMYRDKQARRSA
jgi:diguanylate cyclase (GGDEF)-like protein